MIIEVAPPPPLQIPAKPYLPLFVYKTVYNDCTILAPDIPIGCPMATAPPCTLTLLTSNSIKFKLAKTVVEKASLNSK